MLCRNLHWRGVGIPEALHGLMICGTWVLRNAGHRAACCA
jgi:hypothetical protein